MPIYRFHCGACQKFHETYYSWKYGDGIAFVDDTSMESCPACKAAVEQEPVLCIMRPDKFWSGVYLESIDEHLTSESKYRRILKERGLEVIGDRTDRESLTKIAKAADKDKDIKSERKIEKALIDLYKSEEFGHFGTVRERNKKAQAIAEAESADPQDVCIDEAFK